MTPKQGTRERVYLLTTFLRDDNGDMVPETDKVLAGTLSETVAHKVVEVFRAHRNGHVTMVHDPHAERFLGRLGEMLTASGSPKGVESWLEEKDSEDSKLEKLLAQVEGGLP